MKFGMTPAQAPVLVLVLVQVTNLRLVTTGYDKCEYTSYTSAFYKLVTGGYS